MTLFKQIIIMLGITFITLFASTFYVSTENIRDYLDEQLSSHAQDAATSLGVAISAEISVADIAGIEVYTNVIFDSGYYKQIVIKDINHKILFEKRRSLIINTVPSWFIQLFPLTPPVREANIEKGWQTIGTIYIQSYPLFAYEKLWKNTLNNLQIYVLVMLLTLLLVALALNFLLKPLIAIRQQASAICRKEFPIIDIKPKTLEFLQLVNALNSMSRKLKMIFSEQAKITQDLQKQAFQDDTTGLSNRAIFTKQLNYFCDSENDSGQGCLLIMQINNFTDFNKNYGYNKGNELLKSLAELLKTQSSSYPDALLARLSGSEFAILIKTISTDAIIQMGEQLQASLLAISHNLQLADIDIAHNGMVTTHLNQDAGSLLATADMALRLAQQKGINAWHFYDQQHSDFQSHGAEQWHDIIMQAVDTDLFELYLQNTIDADNNIIMQEVLLRLQHQEKLVPAGIFIPMAEHLQITRFIDRWVISKILSRIKVDNTPFYCVNLSQNTLQDSSFPLWLQTQLKPFSTTQQNSLIIETPEYNVLKNLSEYKNLLNNMASFACRFSIDHFGTGFSSMSYLQDIKINFIKIHGSYAANIHHDKDIINYVRQIITSAHNLEIYVIAEGIEHEESMKILKELKLDYYQGYFISRPKSESTS